MADLKAAFVTVKEERLTDGSVVFDCVLQDRVTGSEIIVSCMDAAHAERICDELSLAGFHLY